MADFTLGEWIGIALGVLALIFGGLFVEYIKRPRLDIRAATWSASGAVPFKFAVVHVFNAPIRGPLGRLLLRQRAEAARIRLEWYLNGALVIAPYDGRWSDTPEPFTFAPGAVFPGGVETIPVFDVAKAMQSRLNSIAPGGDGSEVAVAVLRADGTAHAWGPESYEYDDWRKPEWELDRGDYELRVRVTAGGAEASKTLRVTFLSDDFAAFRTTAR